MVIIILLILLLILLLLFLYCSLVLAKYADNEINDEVFEYKKI